MVGTADQRPQVDPLPPRPPAALVEAVERQDVVDQEVEVVDLSDH